MELLEVKEYVLLIAFVAFVGYALWQRQQAGEPITLAAIMAAVEEATPQIKQVDMVAEAAVLAQEQIKRDKGITNEEAFREVFALLRAKFPVTSGVTDEDIIRVINKWVLIASEKTAVIEAAKQGKP